MRLGLSVHDKRLSHCVVCASHGLCDDDNNNFIVDPYHYLSCKYTRASTFINRHNSVVKILADAAEKAGLDCTLEPSHLSDENNKRPDLIIHYNDNVYIVDVAIVHPTAASYLKVSTKQFAISDAKAVDKIRKYSSLTGKNNAKFIPFIVETYGGIHSTALEFIETISIAAGENTFSLHTSNEIYHMLTNSIACAVQIGNANACQASFNIQSKFSIFDRHVKLSKNRKRKKKNNANSAKKQPKTIIPAELPLNNTIVNESYDKITVDNSENIIPKTPAKSSLKNFKLISNSDRNVIFTPLNNNSSLISINNVISRKSIFATPGEVEYDLNYSISADEINQLLYLLNGNNYNLVRNSASVIAVDSIDGNSVVNSSSDLVSILSEKR